MFNLQNRFLGVDIRKASLRFAAVRKKGRQWMITSLKEIAGETHHLPLFAQRFKDEILISALPTREVLMRPCDIPLKKPKDIFAALNFHVEPLLPYPLEKAVIQAQVAAPLENATLLNIFSIRKDHLASHLELLKGLRLEPEIVTTRLHALAALSSLLPQTNAPFLIFHEGEEEFSLVFVEKGSLLAARSIDPKKDWESEIQKTLLSFSSSYKNKAFEAIYFFGKDLALKNLLQTESGKPVLFPSSPLITLTQEEWIHFGLAIGTALAHQEINFRQKEFAYPYKFKRLKKPLATYFALSMALTGAVCFFSELTLSQKKQEIQEAYQGLIKSEKISSQQNKVLETAEDYSFLLTAIEKEVKSRPETFPLHPQVPKVKEVLCWLTALTKQQGEGSPALVIESLHYYMIKRPDFSHKQEHYKVRVDLEFTVKDPSAARAFQEAIKNAHSLVDSSEEIQWLPAKNKYKASFFLKDKTKYG
jgi:type IV pilus assembly protein PilM